MSKKIFSIVMNFICGNVTSMIMIMSGWKLWFLSEAIYTDLQSVIVELVAYTLVLIYSFVMTVRHMTKAVTTAMQIREERKGFKTQRA